MVNAKEMAVLRAVAALEREEPGSIRTHRAVAEVMEQRGTDRAQTTVKTRLQELRDRGYVESVRVTADHPRYGNRTGRPPIEYSLTEEGWIVGLEHCKAMIQDFGADPADLFDIDDIASENWV
jgi:DNA-binding MarR family transcriptional regulator